MAACASGGSCGCGAGAACLSGACSLVDGYRHGLHLLRLCADGRLLGHGGRYADRLRLASGNRPLWLILLSVFDESLIERLRHAGLSLLRIEEVLFLRSGDESQLDQTTRHGRLAEHEESRLVHPLVIASYVRAHTALDKPCQLNAALHVRALDKLKHDVALRRLRVEALVSLLVVLL